MFKTLPAVMRASALTLAVSSFAPTALAQAATFNVRDADHPARAAFQVRLCTFGWPPGCGQVASQYRVPTGHRLVIEFVSATCLVGVVTQRMGYMSVTTRVDGTFANHYFVPIASAGQIERVSLVSQPARIYADPDTTVDPSATSSGGDVGCLVTLSGHLVRL